MSAATNWEDVYQTQAARIQELERRNAELLRLIGNPNAMHAHYLRHLPGWEVWSTERVRKLDHDNERLEAEKVALQAHAERVGQANDLLVLENTALQADKERLDWLDSYISTDDTNAVFPRIKRAECHSIREAIDAARKEAQP